MICIDNVTIQSGRFGLQNVSLSVGSGEYVVLMGQTGCGKTTLVEAICGLRPIKWGRILICNEDVTRASPAERNLGYVPQDLALFPTMTVSQHLKFALQLRGVARQLQDQRTEELAEQLSIGHLLGRFPKGLSGGESQRVALGRALSFRPPVLILDEPLSALDDDTREGLVELLQQLKNTRSVTVIHITHNRYEATKLGDRVIQLKECCASSALP